MEFLRVIEKVARRIAPGRAPSYAEANVIIALEMLDAKEIVGRTKLSRELEVGEGVTRTLVKHLKREEMIEVSRKGIMLSESGKELYAELRSHISEGVEIPPSSLTVGSHNTAVLVKNKGHRVKYGLEQRDAAIRAGASGATTLVFSENRLTMPRVKEDVLKEVPLVNDVLMSKLSPKENDVIIIGSAEDEKTADFATKMAALDLLKLQKDNSQ